MSLPVLAQLKDNITKAGVAIHNWTSNPADIRLPDVVNTKRPKLSNRQISERYLASVKGNLEIDINKLPKAKGKKTSEDSGMSHLSAIHHMLNSWIPSLPVAEAGLIGKDGEKHYHDGFNFRNMQRTAKFMDLKLEYVGYGQPPEQLQDLPVVSDGDNDRAAAFLRTLLYYPTAVDLLIHSDPIPWPGAIQDFANHRIPHEHLSEHGVSRWIRLESLLAGYQGNCVFVFLRPGERAEWMEWRRKHGLAEDLPHFLISSNPAAQDTDAPRASGYLKWATAALATAALGTFFADAFITLRNRMYARPPILHALPVPTAPVAQTAPAA